MPKCNQKEYDDLRLWKQETTITLQQAYRDRLELARVRANYQVTASAVLWVALAAAAFFAVMAVRDCWQRRRRKKLE